MFEGSLISNFLDQERYDKVNISNYKQDSYILYNRDGEMVISTLIDIEVVFRKNTNIKKKNNDRFKKYKYEYFKQKNFRSL